MIWGPSISQPLYSHLIWSTSISYGPPLSLKHYLLSDMVHLYLSTTISYPIWSTSISQALSPIHCLSSDKVHLYLPTTVSHPIWSTSISQALSPIWYGPPLSLKHYLLYDMVHLLSHNHYLSIRYGPPLSPNHCLSSDMVHLYLPYGHYILYLIMVTTSYLIWATSISQALSPIWYGPLLSHNHYLSSDKVHLYLPTTVSHPIWSTSISQSLYPIWYGPPQSHMGHLYLSSTISYLIRSTSISQPLSLFRYGPPLSPNHYSLLCVWFKLTMILALTDSENSALYNNAELCTLNLRSHYSWTDDSIGLYFGYMIPYVYTMEANKLYTISAFPAFICRSWLCLVL